MCLRVYSRTLPCGLRWRLHCLSTDPEPELSRSCCASFPSVLPPPAVLPCEGGWIYSRCRSVCSSSLHGMDVHCGVSLGGLTATLSNTGIAIRLSRSSPSPLPVCFSLRALLLLLLSLGLVQPFPVPLEILLVFHTELCFCLVANLNVVSR